MKRRKGYSTVLNFKGGRGGIIWGGRKFFLKFFKRAQGPKEKSITEL